MYCVLIDSLSGSLGNVFCKFITGGAFIWLSAAAAALLLIAIAAERYFAIVHPLRNKYRLNKKRVVVITAFSWGFACLLSAPSMAAISYDQERDFCVEKWPDWYPEKGHVCFVFFVNCVLSIVSMTFLYFKVIYKLWSNSPTATSSVQAARLKARKRVTVMLVVVTLTHTLCWTPNYVLYLLIFFVPGLSYGSTKYIITVLLILLNAAVDPLLYTWYMDGFKRGIQNMLCRHINRNRVRRVGDTAGQYFVETPVGLMFSTTMEPNHIINT